MPSIFGRGAFIFIVFLFLARKSTTVLNSGLSLGLFGFGIHSMGTAFRAAETRQCPEAR
jgi:hypothetical protein